MKIATATLRSVSPYSQSRPHDEPKLNKETADAYEERTWRKRMHVTDSGEVYIPAIAIKVALAESAKYLSRQIPGKGKATYTKHFEAGVIPVADKAPLGIQAEDVKGERLFLNADGQRGGGRRVWKTYPVIPEWEAEVQFLIADDIITEDVFRDFLENAGQLIGIGRWRPRNGGMNGRFSVVNLHWEEK